MDVTKQIEYWAASSAEDIAAAESLLEQGHLRHCLFFAHLSLEKLLKAHVVRQTGDVPPRIHSLIRLAEIAGLALDEERDEFIRSFGVYQLEGRYPDARFYALEADYALAELSRTKETLEWLKNQL